MARTLLLFTFICALISSSINISFADNIYEGELEILYIDSDKNPQKLFRLSQADGSKKILELPEDFNYPAGSTLKFKAKEKNGRLKISKVFSSKLKSRLVGSTLNTTGTQKLLVIMATDASFSQSFIPYSVSEIEDIFFGPNLSLSDYMSEASAGKLNVVGQVIPTLSIPNLCQSDNLFAHQAEETIIAAAETKIDDITSYDYVTMIVPDRDDCLSNASGIGTLGRIRYNSQDGVVTLGMNFTRAYPVDRFDRVLLSTAIHELGHNFGLNHGNVNSCGREIFSSEACPGVEYGDGHGIMGTTPNISHYNMIQKEDLGWLSSNEILTINEDSLKEGIELLPVASKSSGIKMIKVRRDDGRYYSIEYRQGIGYDSVKERDFNSLNFGGFLVYLDEETVGNRPLMIDSNFEDFRASSELRTGFGLSYYVNFDITSSMHNRGLFSLNETFNDTVSDIVVSAQSLNSASALITVNKGSVIDDGSNNNNDDEEDPNPDSDNDDSGDNSDEGFKVSFMNPKTFGSDISLNFKKKTRIFAVVSRDNSQIDNSKNYTVKRSSVSRRISKIKKNKFKLRNGITVPVVLAPERTFIKRGFQKNSEGKYTVFIDIQERGKFASSSPERFSFQVSPSDFN